MGQLLSTQPRSLLVSNPSQSPIDSENAPYRTHTPLAELQKAFLDLRFCMFIHFNMATFQDLEWGDDRQPVETFNPTCLDTDQWAEAALSAGMKGGFLTTKHHDGFCLWPTRTGTQSVLHTPFKGDVVASYAASFRKRGLKVGLYYSILDKRNDIRRFNVTPSKIQLVKDHLAELLTNYGDINMLIFDGWPAPWSRIPYSEFPFNEIYYHIKSLQPDCLVTDLNSQVFPSAGMFYCDIKAFEANAGEILPAANELPAFSCITITDGWFFKTSDTHATLKSTESIVTDWLIPNNIRNSTLILNAPPNREGRLSLNIIKALQDIGHRWSHPGAAQALPSGESFEPVTTKNLAERVSIRASGSTDGTGPDYANDGDIGTTWYTPPGETEGWLELSFPEMVSFNRVMLAEPIGRWGDYPVSRIGRYTWEVHREEKWIIVAEGNNGPSPEGVTLHWVKRVEAKRLRLRFTVLHDTAHVNQIGVYDEPRSTNTMGEGNASSQKV